MSRKQIDEIKDFLCICADDKFSSIQKPHAASQSRNVGSLKAAP